MLKKALILLLLILPSLAQAEIKRLAVLEFTGVGVDQNTLLLFSDQARAGILKVINKDDILVMTRESTRKILKDMGKDISCMDGSCEVEIAENIGADYVVSGMVVKSGFEFVLTLKFFETHSSALLATQTADSTSLSTLRKTRQIFLAN